MKIKRLAVISYHTCPLSDEVDAEIGGMNIYVLELSKAMAAQGCIIDIYTRSQDAKSPRVVSVSENLRVIHVPAGPEKPLSKKHIEQYIPDFLDYFYQFMTQEDLTYDAVSCHYYLSGLIGKAIRERLGIPFLITFHTLGLMKNLVARSESERESIDRINAEMMLVQEADRIVATSETDAQYIQALYDGDPEKMLVLLPGVDLERFKPQDKVKAKEVIGASTETKLILFVGRIEPLKGVDALLYSIKIMQHRYPNLRACVRIVGGDISQDSAKWPKELQKLDGIRKVLGLTTAVSFVGRKLPDELPDYYNAADVMVMPSHYESFGITAVEAMACGTPVITTDVTGVSHIFDQKHAFLITSANNTLQLADRIADVLSGSTNVSGLGKELSDKVQDLSWYNTAKRFLKECVSCMKK